MSQTILLRLMVMDMASDVSPKSLKEKLEQIFITPIEMIVATIMKGIENKIALVRFLGSFNGIHLLFINSTCNCGLLLGNLLRIFTTSAPLTM